MSEKRDKAPGLTRKRDLFLAFGIVSLPLLIISLILIGLVFNTLERVKPDPSIGRWELPVVQYDTATAYYTGIRPGSFLLLGSWASNIAEIVVAPFMLIFSYAVAREVVHGSVKEDTISELRLPFLSEMIRGSHIGLWHLGSHLIDKRNKPARQKPASFRVVSVAGFGLLTASLLTLLVIIGDNWLHTTTYAMQIRHYDHINNSSPEVTRWLNLTGQPSFKPIDTCNETLTASLPPDISSAPLPCSLNKTDGVTNVMNPDFVYRTLSQGISQINSSFNNVNFTTLLDAESTGHSTPYQVVTTLQNGTSHSIFFNPNAAEEDDYTDYGYGSQYGIDYVGNTVSMSTSCRMATRDCNLTALSLTSSKLDQNNLSIPFHCYDGFSGNLGQTPATGHERAQGWNMSFYSVNNGSPRNIPVQAQSNPFNFYVAAAVNSISFQDLLQSGSPEAQSNDGSLVDAGGGFTAFALDCKATIYDVRFSLVNGSFLQFDATRASPQKASIIKAPLQVGFGQYHLYEAAHAAVLPSDTSIADTMSISFSQTGMALASGPFELDDDALVRLRWTVTVTKVHKAPFWFLVITCFVYAVVGMAMTILAFLLRRTPEIREHQAILMAKWGPEILNEEREGRGEREDSRFDGDSLNFS